jgi:cell division protein FtsN
MAARRTSRSRPRKSKGLPVWAVMLIGLALGAALMWGGQRLFFHGGKPLSGIASLFSGPKTTATTQKPAAQATKEPDKPQFDFYTILPEIETVLPDRRDKLAKSAPKSPTRPGQADDTDTSDKTVVYVLQAASYASLEDADRLKAKLVLNGLETRIEKITIEGKGDFFRVRLGPYSRLADLDAANARLAQQGIKALRLKVKKSPGA